MAEEKVKKSESTEAEKVAEPAETGKAAEPAKKKKRSKKKNLIEGRICIFASYNNTIVTVTDMKGDPVCWSSSGACGFKGTRKSTPYAAQVTAEKTMEKAKLLGLERAQIFVKGTGIGRDQALRAIAAQSIDMQSITDLTSLAHGGVRTRKARRV